MSAPDLTEMFALLARYGADGDLKTPEILAAIRAMAGEQTESDPGAAALLAKIIQQRDAAPESVPAIDALISHIQQTRQAAANRFRQQSRSEAFDPADFERLLGDLPLDDLAPAVLPTAGTDAPSQHILESAISLARDRRFLSSRRSQAPTAAAALDRQYKVIGLDIFELLEKKNRRLALRIIRQLQQQGQSVVRPGLDHSGTEVLENLKNCLEQIRIAAEADPQSGPAKPESADEHSLQSLEVAFHSADTPQRRQQILDSICVWPGQDHFEVLLQLGRSDEDVRERAGLILTCRYGPRPVAGWNGWKNALERAIRLRRDKLQQLINQAPAELLLIWVSQSEGLAPEIRTVLNQYCETHAAPVDADDFAERWTGVLPTSEFNTLVGMDFESESAAADEPHASASSSGSVQPASAQPVTVSPDAPSPAAPAGPPRTTSTVWRDHIQPLLTENWYLVAGIVMVVAGASLISVFFWDKSPFIRFTLMPALLAGFTLAVAAAGSWIERQHLKFRGTAAILRGAAVALLPLNFMVVSLLAGEDDLAGKSFFVMVMGLAYLLLFGRALRRWCRAVHEPLALPLGSALLLINGLVMIGPLAETMAQSDWGGLPVLIAIGFYAGFVLVAWTVVQFASHILTPELAAEKRVPWFVGGTLGVSFLQVFGWVHFQLGHLPHVSTYAVLLILAGWLVLFIERRAIELRGSAERLDAESFLGYALVLLGVLMGSAQESVRIAALALAGVAWLYQAVGRNHELQHWIGLTLLSLSGASIALLTGFPRNPWLPLVGMGLVLLMGLMHWFGLQRNRTLLARVALDMQPPLALLTAVVAVLAQWHFRSTPVWTAGFLLTSVSVFAWRAWRDQELRWVHAAMAIVGISLPYLGCVDMRGWQLHGNTMTFGLAVTSLGWLILVGFTRSSLLKKARSTVLMVYGSIAVAAMVLRVLFEGSTIADLQPWQQFMDYSGPLLMAGLLAVATFHTRSLIPAAMATVIAVILFPELRARFRDAFESIGWGTGLGSACSALGLALACFPLSRCRWLQDLGEGDRFLGRIPFPFRRHDHTLFTWPLTASAVFLSARVELWTVLQNALPEQSLSHLIHIDLSLIPLKTSIAVSLTGITWTLLAVFFRSHRSSAVGVHLGWISLLAGFLLINHHLEAAWSWPYLATGLTLQGLELVCRRIQTGSPWVLDLLITPIRNVLMIGSLVMASICSIAVIVQGSAELTELSVLILFVAAQLVRSGLTTGRSVFGGFLFAMTWISLLAITSPGDAPLLTRLSFSTVFYTTLWLVICVQVIHIGLESTRPLHRTLQPLMQPFLTGASLLTVVMIILSCLDSVTNIQLPEDQRWMLLGVTLLDARNHGSAWLALLGLLQACLYGHLLAGQLKPGEPIANIFILIEPWRCATLGLAAAALGQSGRLLFRTRPTLLSGPFSQPVFRSQDVAWLFGPAVALAVFATGYHTLTASFRDAAIQLQAPFLACAGLSIVAFSVRSQALAWLSVLTLGLGNTHGVRLYFGDALTQQNISDIHLFALGQVLTLLQLTAIRQMWRSDRVASFVHRASLMLAGLVLTLICFNYVTDPGLADIPWGRFVISGVMAGVAGLYFRATARRQAADAETVVIWSEAGYHFGITLAMWCAALLIPSLREPTTALFALAVPIVYLYARAEQGFASGFEFARRYRDSAAALSFTIFGVWIFRGAFHLLMFPDQEFDVISYHTNAPLVILLAIVMLRLHGLGGTGWLAMYGGLALLVGTFYSLTWIDTLRPDNHPIAAAWCAIGLAHFWTLVSHQRSPLRTAIQQMALIDGPNWFQFRRTWGVCLLIGTHAAVIWGLFESLGIGRFVRTDTGEQLAFPLLLGAASVLIHMGVIRRSAVYFGIALVEVVLALHTGFVIDSYLPQQHVVWVILGLWASGLIAWEFAPRHVQARRLGTASAVLCGLVLSHIVFEHHPGSVTGLWVFAVMALLAGWTPRWTRSAQTGEETTAAGLLLAVPTWLVFFSQIKVDGEFGVVLSTWPVLAATAAIFVTGGLCRWFQVRLLPDYDAWHRPRPRLFDQTLWLAGQSGGTINTLTLRCSFVVAVLVQMLHYRTPLETGDVILLCLLYAGYSLAWYFEGRRTQTFSGYVVLQLCVLGFFTTLRRQLINTMPDVWTPEYDVWASLAVSFGLCGAKQFIDTRPREIRIPLLGTLITLPVVALIWVLVNRMGSDVALIVVGLHSLMFTFLGKDDRKSPYNIVAVGGFVTFVLVYFWTQLELRALHAFIIPVGMGILILLQLFRDRIALDARNRIRLVTLIAMLSSTGFYALVDARYPVSFNLTLILLCLLSMGLGSFLRIRLYLFLGFATLLVDIGSILFKVIRGADQAVQSFTVGALLVIIGTGLVGGAIYFKTHRDEINGKLNRWRSRLGDWE